MGTSSLDIHWEQREHRAHLGDYYADVCSVEIVCIFSTDHRAATWDLYLTVPPGFRVYGWGQRMSEQPNCQHVNIREGAGGVLHNDTNDDHVVQLMGYFDGAAHYVNLKPEEQLTWEGEPLQRAFGVGVSPDPAPRAPTIWDHLTSEE